MRILLNKTSTETQKYNLLSSCKIEPITQEITNQDVIALIENENFEEALKTVINLNVPVVAITNKDSQFYNQALNLIHPDGVVFYENGKILSQNKVFAEAQGVTVKILEMICQYALENMLRPEIYVWKPQEEIIRFTPEVNQKIRPEIPQETRQEAPRTIKQEIPQEARQEDSVKPKNKTYTPAQTDLRNYIKSCDQIIAVFKTSPTANSSHIASELAKKLNTVYLNISSESTQNQSPYYAYSDGSTVNYNSSVVPGKYLVTEVDAQIPEALELVYSLAYKIVHVAANPSESLEPLRAWVGSGFRLDAVIPTQVKDMPAYNEFPVYSVENFVKLL